ncbi:hypothetical protein KKC17_00365 [Patescibacteria group bacterium]|nr:hypothetical protein [Patescibacteria group bacterium]
MINLSILDYRVSKLIRRWLGELSLGLLGAWWLMWLLELVRPGGVSLYLDLNLILVLALIAWLIGQPVKQGNKLAYYSQLILSVIIISVLIVRLIK